MTAPLDLTREQILSHRRRVGGLDERLPMSAASLRRAAWIGLQDSMPRAALLSLHARVAGVRPTTWEHPSLVQIWGPRFSAYVVAKRDVAPFTLGRMPDDAAARRRYDELAARLHAYLRGRRVSFAELARPLRLPHPNYLRYATATGRVRIRWDGARQPTVWTEPAPPIDFRAARLELLRRYLHVFGPGTPSSFAQWAGVRPPTARAAFDGLARSLVPVRTPIGEGWIQSGDEASLRARPAPAEAVRLLPSGDPYYLLQGTERALLVPDTKRRASLWTTRVWPGALLVHGEVVGTWRRDAADVTMQPWQRLSRVERDDVTAEARALPLSAPSGIVVHWE